VLVGAYTLQSTLLVLFTWWQGALGDEGKERASPDLRDFDNRFRSFSRSTLAS
jgi:hypothetical protein